MIVEVQPEYESAGGRGDVEVQSPERGRTAHLRCNQVQKESRYPLTGGVIAPVPGVPVKFKGASRFVSGRLPRLQALGFEPERGTDSMLEICQKVQELRSEPVIVRGLARAETVHHVPHRPVRHRLIGRAWPPVSVLEFTRHEQDIITRQELVNIANSVVHPYDSIREILNEVELHPLSLTQAYWPGCYRKRNLIGAFVALRKVHPLAGNCRIFSSREPSATFGLTTRLSQQGNCRFEALSAALDSRKPFGEGHLYDVRGARSLRGLTNSRRTPNVSLDQLVRAGKD
jgi:hypothetical protein